GDDFIRRYVSMTTPGTPPRAWGRPTIRCDFLQRRRYTPTRVGTTHRRWQNSSTVTVHPHARGDEQTGIAIRTIEGGTPPRAWGRHLRIHHENFPIRYTPTRVGTTSNQESASLASSVHPHARGDDTKKTP